MSTWIRRAYDAPGLTQRPPGKHLASIQGRFGGAVVICLDVSGSMHGNPLAQAVVGCERFVDEALAGYYEVSMLFWHGGVAGYTPLTRDRRKVISFLRSAAAGGSNDIVPALDRCSALLRDRTGDRVVAIFGDGDLGNEQPARQKADTLRADNIRIITCGLGQASAESLAVISTETTSAGPRVANADSIADSIADMAKGLRRGGRR